MIRKIENWKPSKEQENNLFVKTIEDFNKFYPNYKIIKDSKNDYYLIQDKYVKFLTDNKKDVVKVALEKIQNNRERYEEDDINGDDNFLK